MAKGPYLTDRIRQMIAEIYHAEPQVKSGKAREKLLQRMKAEGLNETFGSNYPSRSTLSVELKSLREKNEARPPESKGLDQPWTIGSLSKYPIPPEALPIVMAIYRKAPTTSREITPEGEVAYVMLENSRALTIREAQWIARLYKVIDDPDLLWDWAWLYAQDEWVAEVTGKPFFFPEFDLELMENPQYATESRRAQERWGAIWHIAEKYSADLDETLDLMNELNKLDWSTLSNEEIEEIAKPGKYRKEAQHEKGHEKRNTQAR